MQPAVALIQLPVLDPDPATMRNNVQLTAGSLKSFCVARGGMNASTIRIIPRTIADHGGDEAIVSWVQSAGPDLVGFSCSMWNVRRSMAIAQKIKERLPGTLTMAGGPEIVAGERILESAAFDSFVIGEGEGAFLQACRDLAAGRPLERLYAHGALLDLAAVPNPYLSATMEYPPGDPLYLETLRGCSHRCSYCYCGKAYPSVRHFSRQIVDEIFPWAREHEVAQIYVLDPSFDSVAGWEDRLRLYASLNEAGVAMHTEIHLESVATPERADLLVRAGFRSIEAGLQSTNERALAAVHRSWDRDRFLRGAALVRERGIHLTIGIILGLPEDTREGFAETVRFLSDNGLRDNMNILPLSVLPGTALREEAQQLGIRFMPDPPYIALSTPTMNGDDLHDALGGARGALPDDDGSVFAPPHFRDETSGFAGFLDLRSGKRFPRPDQLANSITVLIDATAAAGPRVDEAGAWFLRTVPHGLFQVVVESEDPLPHETAERVARAFDLPDRWFNTARSLARGRRAGRSIALFRLARGIGRGNTVPEEADLILRFSPALLSDGASALAGKPFLLMAGAIPQAAEDELARIYQGCAERLLRTDRPI